MIPLTPANISAPLARYSHGTLSEPGSRLLAVSGQLGVANDGSVPASAEAQAHNCFANIDAILAEAAASRADVLRLNAYVTDRVHMADYMSARDAWLEGVSALPASTLVIVAGFTRPEFVVEVEALAAVRDLA